MRRYPHAWAAGLLCAAGLLACEQPLIGPERKAPFAFPYDSLNGTLYLAYVDDTKSPRQSVGMLAYAENRLSLLIEAPERAYLRRDSRLMLAKDASVGDSVYYQYYRFFPDMESYIPDNQLYEGIPVGITGIDSLHALSWRWRTDSSGQRFEVRWLIHDLSRFQTHLRQAVTLPAGSSLGYEALGGSVVFPDGLRLLLRTDDRYLICDGTSAEEITLEGGNPLAQHALSIDPAGRTLAYTEYFGPSVRFRDLENGAEISYELPEGSFFRASAWAPSGEPRVLLAGDSGLLEVHTTGKSLPRMVFPSGSGITFWNLSWNP
ncbi:MAG: hypothetical protein NW241_16760 [Bacteroidia bacterium]|nr:hypothetical protein [Bacteroidia bacterium]